MSNYQILTGYWSGKGCRGEDGDERAIFFNDYWYPNTVKYGKTTDIFVINSNSTIVPEKLGAWLDLQFNFGHLGDWDGKNKFTGWAMTFILGAIVAYANNKDLIFKEQDCLAFGNWVEAMYETMDKTGAEMVIGAPEDSNGQALEQSLFMIKRASILDFVMAYLDIPQNDREMINESKFKHILDNQFKRRSAYLPFGYGRRRPKKWQDETFYIQQVTQEEIDKLKELNLV